ncbi:IMPACT family protein [Marinobacter sp. M1N3S26]|uniref:IMPACT family protein n=1 Tax=unclassified Marinobacter TaxID=83889 RepID=UPI00387AB783
MSVGYPIPAGVLEKETEIRKSRFIARVAPVHDREQVKALVHLAWQDHPDARHVCWAYQIGQPGSAAEAAMNDDGEPSGTAGKPILNVIQHKDMGDVAVIVIRYFGGIKLGAGGLVRAYAGAAESVLSAVERKVNRPMEEVVVSLPFALEQPLRHWCEQHDADPAEAVYGDGVTMTVYLPEPAKESLVSFCEANQLDYHYPDRAG